MTTATSARGVGDGLANGIAESGSLPERRFAASHFSSALVWATVALMATEHTLANRIARLERANKRLFLLAGLLALLYCVSAAISCVGGATASSPTAPKTLSVKGVNIVNDEGKVVVHLGVRTSGAGGLWLANADGTRVLKLNQNERGGLITIMDRSGRRRGYGRRHP